MKRGLLICLLVVGGAFLSWAITATLASQLFDEATSRQEIETMRVILRTTMDYALRGTSQPDDGSDAGSEEWELLGANLSPQINGYYLYGQGAVFTISLDLPPFPPAPPPAPPAPAALPVPPAPPAPPAPAMGGMPDDEAVAALAANASKEAQKQAEAARKQLKLQEKDLAKQLEKAQEQIKQLQEHKRHFKEQMERDHAKTAERLAAAKGVLMEALAKHGDSLTVVRPQEYITLILSGDSGKWFLLGMQERRTSKQILSIQKSVISDYKAGKFSLEEFKKKVLSYTN